MPKLLDWKELTIQNESPIIEINNDSWNRTILYQGKKAFKLPFFCDTCEGHFERYGNQAMEMGRELSACLNAGLVSIDEEVSEAVSMLLPTGRYVVLLTEFAPVWVRMVQQNKKQKLLHQIPYIHGEEYYRGSYRTLQSPRKDLLVEYVAPFYPTQHLDELVVQCYRAQISEGKTPTALSFSVFNWQVNERYFEHLGIYDSPDIIHTIGHYLLDGHHKIYSASLERGKITMLSFLYMDLFHGYHR